MNTVWLIQRVLTVALVLFCGQAAGWTQEEPSLDIRLYLFSISAGEMDSLLEEGLTRREITRLQTDMFENNALLPDNEPLHVQPGKNELSIPQQAIASLQTRVQRDYVVFMFVMERLQGNESATIETESFAVGEELGERIKVRSKTHTWKFPARVNRYRFMDFRYAQMMQYLSFNYILRVQTPDRNNEYRILLDLTGD